MNELRTCEFNYSTMGFDLHIKAQFFINPSGPKVKEFEMTATETGTKKPVTDKTTLSFLHSYVGPKMSQLVNERYDG